MVKIVQADESGIEEGAKLIKDGGILAFPTETVYGVGADIFNEDACKKIFEIKQRPMDKPLVAHISRMEVLENLCNNISEDAKRLMSAFMPGPLTVVLAKSERINRIVSGGTDTVGVRMPANKTTLCLIDKCGGAIAGTSANFSGSQPPCLAKEVTLCVTVLEGGVGTGLPSTVIDMTQKPPVIIRQGGVLQEDIEKIVGKVKLQGEEK